MDHTKGQAFWGAQRDRPFGEYFGKRAAVLGLMGRRVLLIVPRGTCIRRFSAAALFVYGGALLMGIRSGSRGSRGRRGRH